VPAEAQQQQHRVTFFQLQATKGGATCHLTAADIKGVISQLVARRQLLNEAKSGRKGGAVAGQAPTAMLQLIKPTAAASNAGSGGQALTGTSSSPSSFVLTPTTQENLERVLDVVDNPQPLLLEGPTGVGKSAIIAEAARRCGARLVRFNMSSRLTIEDLLGRVLLRGGVSPAGSPGDSAVPRLELQLQPFSEAFVRGHWLLLDELNLAPDDVLQCIEQAIDTGVSSKHTAVLCRRVCIPHQPGITRHVVVHHQA
jgi:hypothetical protein